MFSPGASSSDVPVDGFDGFLELLWRYLGSQGVEVEGPPLYSMWNSGVYNPFLKIRLSKEMGDTDIIHAQDEIGFMLKRNSIPLILSNQLYPFDPVYQRYTNCRQKVYQQLFLKRYMRKSYAVADAVIVPSKFTAEAIRSDYPDLNLHVIANGIDTEVFKPVDVADPFPGKTKLLFVGNWIRRKGADLLPAIMDRLGEDFILMHAGLRKGPDFSVGCRKIKSCRSLSYSSKELVKLYNSCDIFIFPSRLEGLPFAVIEAMACGKPVVATNYSSLPELVVDGEGGYLCDMDNVEAFTEKINQLAFDSALRKKMGKFNRQRVEDKFTCQRMGEEYLRLYKQFL